MKRLDAGEVSQACLACIDQVLDNHNEGSEFSYIGKKGRAIRRVS